MKKNFTVVLMIFVLSAFTFAQTADEQAVIKVKRDIVNAVLKGDAKILDRLIADNSTDTSTDGFVGTKQDVLNGLQPLNNIFIDVFGMRVRVYGNAAVATGKMEIKIKQDSQENSDYVRFTDTFVKGKNGWQLVASQQNKIPVWLARDIADSELKPLVPVECEQESSLKSMNDDIRTFVRFTNSTKQSVTIYWINYEGKRDPREDQRQTLEPGRSGARQTFLTHPFLITDASGKCIGIYQPAREPGIVVIK